MDKELIREQLLNILIDQYKVKAERNNSTFDLILLGKEMNMGPGDLLCFFLEVEKKYNININEEEIMNGGFKTINSIAQLICEKSDYCLPGDPNAELQ